MASAVTGVVPDSVVDLKSPEVRIPSSLSQIHNQIITLACHFMVVLTIRVNLQLAVLIELLPLSGVPKESLVVAVSVLPQNVVSVKPRLCIKALVSDTKTKGKKN